MNQFSEMSHASLLDLLARYTTDYTQMLSDNNKSNEFYKCKRLLEQVTTELEHRMRNNKSNDADQPVLQPRDE